MGRTHIYKARDGYRWRAIAANGNIVAESGEAYTQRYRARKYAAKYGPVGFEVVIDAK